jgi:hypothetical protein
MHIEKASLYADFCIALFFLKDVLVDLTGIEPVTSSMP